MFGRKKKTEVSNYNFNPEKQKAVIHCSICTGEQVAGFKDIATGHFEEIMLIRGEEDLEAFKEKYGVTDITKEY
ncbi:MAG: aspartate dehydrogenase [Blautia sp.]|nr:aspartate dehydrogenase [Blautia sp.]